METPDGHPDTCYAEIPDSEVVQYTLDYVRMRLEPKRLFLYGAAAHGYFDYDRHVQVLAVIDYEPGDLKRSIEGALGRRRIDADLVIVTEDRFERDSGRRYSECNLALEHGREVSCGDTLDQHV